ncbi:MAG: DUF72 domain-containing protein [Candidatus Hydrogenedentes bacterium]|nr:DUF72 domain-containing protein [Candidatus Hydrogenedentota bacterium]
MPKTLHPLEYLCGFFDTIEVNSSFYRPPNPVHVKSWVSKIAANTGFQFTFKLWERFTHQRNSWPSADEVRQFTEGIAPALDAGRLGAVLIQFPWSFKRTPESRQWLARVLDAFSAYPLALEIRHASWNVPEVYAGLAERRVAFCNIDQPLFQHSLAPTEQVTARVGYVRLHGRNAADWFREDASRDERYNYLYSKNELEQWLRMIRRMRKLAEEIYVITNNHYEGQAVVNAFEMRHDLEGTPQPVPECLLKAYPRLEEIAKL